MCPQVVYSVLALPARAGGREGTHQFAVIANPVCFPSPPPPSLSSRGEDLKKIARGLRKAVPPTPPPSSQFFIVIQKKNQTTERKINAAKKRRKKDTHNKIPPVFFYTNPSFPLPFLCDSDPVERGGFSGRSRCYILSLATNCGSEGSGCVSSAGLVRKDSVENKKKKKKK